MTVPDWVQDAVFYQIFPDRFANGDLSNDPPNVQHWGAEPTIWGFQGGDLQGIIQHFDYLLDLGITALYLNPIFQATTNHRYNTTDYYHIDPKLGTMEDFRALLDVAHRNQVRLILDGVFNHCGRGFFAFNDILENQEHSPYLDWFHIRNLPVEAYTWGDAVDYLGWWGMKTLPKFNTNTPAVRHYLLDVARYWIEEGIDGWRLDVPNEIDDDSFWAEFRHVVKSANPEAYTLGEIWTPELRWVGDAHFDGLMHYPVRDALLRLLYAGTLDIPHFAEKVESLLSFYPKENAYAMYVPLGTHDTERLLTKVEGDLYKAKLAFLFQFTYPGAPAVYYGDEIGLTGGKDPECRKAFPWNSQHWNTELRDWVKKLIALRKSSPALRRGDYQRVCMNLEIACYAFVRALDDEKVVVAINAGAESRTITAQVDKVGWAEGKVVCNLLDHGEKFQIENGCFQITLPAWGGMILG
ncbi:MAG: glycoside hydrolase family 13 protein [Anaerolineales bacterium]|nr:glycoside hydrolase family 13 protein [Anaerolineales bacterium]